MEVNQSWNFGFDDFIEFTHGIKLKKRNEQQCNIDNKKRQMSDPPFQVKFKETYCLMYVAVHVPCPPMKGALLSYV